MHSQLSCRVENEEKIPSSLIEFVPLWTPVQNKQQSVQSNQFNPYAAGG